MSVAWYWYAGWVTIVLIAGFYLATRKKYRDPTAAPNYETVRNKLTTRKLKVKEDKAEDYTGEGLGLLDNLSNIVMGIVTLGIVIAVGCTILSQLGDTLNESSVSANVTTATSEMLTSTASFIPVIGVVLIATFILAAIIAAFGRAGIV